MLSRNRYTNFFGTHSFYEGVRITIGIMVPVLIAARFDEIGWGLAMALGALCVSLADNAGPLHHRINGMLATLGFVVLALLAFGFALPYPWLVLLLLALFSFFFSWIGVFGTRASNIGTSVLIATTLQLNESVLGVVNNALITAAGGLWYFFLSILLYRLRPYKLAQQLLGECITQTALYLSAKASLYEPHTRPAEAYDNLLKLQAEVHQKQQLVREVLFKTRSIVKESTHTGRVLVMAFLEAVDIFELTLTSETDHGKLHLKLGHTTLLAAFGQFLKDLSAYIHDAGEAMQNGNRLPVRTALSEQLQLLKDQYRLTREQYIHSENADAFNDLNHIHEALHALLNKADSLALYTSYDRKLKLQRQVDYARFVVPSYINLRLLLANTGFGSNIFRYSLRMAMAVSAGYLLSLAMPIGHSYWILLTTVVVLKPAYALTRQRNAQRLWGTLWGGVAAVLLLYLLSDQKNVLLAIMIVAMTGAFSLIRTRYLLSVTLLTLYVIISIYLLQPGAYTPLFKDRLLDTFTGGMIGLLFTAIIPPIWEKTQLRDLLRMAAQTNRAYFGYLCSAFAGRPLQISQYKWYRKETYVALANLSEAFQRMLNEPKNRQEKGEFLHPLIVSFHVLTSRIAALSALSRQKELEMTPEDVALLTQPADTNFALLIKWFEGKGTRIKKQPLPATHNPESIKWKYASRDGIQLESGRKLLNQLDAIASITQEMLQMVQMHYKEEDDGLSLPGDEIL